MSSNSDPSRSSLMFAIKTKERFSDNEVLKLKMSVVVDKIGNVFTGFLTGDIEEQSRSHHTQVYYDNHQFVKWTRKILELCDITKSNEENISYWLIHNGITVVEPNKKGGVLMRALKK